MDDRSLTRGTWGRRHLWTLHPSAKCQTAPTCEAAVKAPEPALDVTAVVLFKLPLGAAPGQAACALGQSWARCTAPPLQGILDPDGLTASPPVTLRRWILFCCLSRQGGSEALLTFAALEVLCRDAGQYGVLCSFPWYWDFFVRGGLWAVLTQLHWGTPALWGSCLRVTLDAGDPVQPQGHEVSRLSLLILSLWADWPHGTGQGFGQLNRTAVFQLEVGCLLSWALLRFLLKKSAHLPGRYNVLKARVWHIVFVFYKICTAYLTDPEEQEWCKLSHRTKRDICKEFYSYSVNCNISTIWFDFRFCKAAIRYLLIFEMLLWCKLIRFSNTWSIFSTQWDKLIVVELTWI